MKQKQPKDPIAFVYLLKENDEANKCIMNSEELLITRKNRATSIRIEEISKITFHHKFFLFPILAGGSFGPFFFIALLSGLFYPAISLTGFIISMVFLYIGFSGKKSIRVETINDIHEFFLPYISANLKEFISFVNELVTGKDSTEVFSFYLPVSKEQVGLLNEGKDILLPERGEYCLTSKRYHLYPPSSNITFVKIHYNDPNVQIKFDKDIQGNLKPKVFGKITADNESVTTQ